VGIAVAAVSLVLLGQAPPAAASAYRYWTYWTADAGAWAFAVEGPATRVPADGAVDGWRFAVTTVAGAPGDAPRVTPDAEAICAGVTAPAGSKRVALIIDSGPTAIAPDGQVPPPVTAQCVVVDAGATSADVLTSVTTVRSEGGLVCALGGYPEGECAPTISSDEAEELVATAEPEPSVAAVPQAAPRDTGSPLPTLIVLTGLALVGAVVAFVIRRRGR
jgi:hypothetical protein